MSPSNSTVFRFIATYGQGFDELVQRLILGYGYQDEGGLTHQELLRLYLGTRMDFTNKLYAGYFMVDRGALQIFSGGSQTLLIPSSEERNKKLLEDLERRKAMRRAIICISASITAGDVRHVLLAP